ncbi:LytTR family transcriptional regulator DNA-binding domain-containing protein [Halobacillus salinarum]|uniref:LytTR family transcriptional regulator DNA-binding domain-containing protein n=1 Tax=Halobacillus salinarum TaxID=2932257 RepID=A0ABY4EI69_9BACI|nr:LytTR family DNA-binding domain-containing protein [Halobacillus salinarum]UOQ43319.1 LytTR family transcriptional regulator DNA-binding domain-containing protein [Halobacillus salinarum]
MDYFSISSLVESFKDLFPKEASIAVSDSRQFIYYKPSKYVDLKIKPGDRIGENTVTFKALAKQDKMSEHINSNVFGTPYFGTSVPIIDEGEAKGCLTAILPSKQLRFLASFLTIHLEDRWFPVPYEDVMFLEAKQRKTWIQSKRGMGTHKFSLSELEFYLPEHLFIRCHRSYIVNVNYIAEIQPDSHSTFLLIMKDKSKVPVSQTFASQFRKILSF